MNRPPTVFVVDENEAMSRRVRLLFDAAEVCIEAHGTADSFWTTYRPDTPGCVVVSARLDGGGLGFIAELQRREDELPVIFLIKDADVSLVVRATRAGVLDLLHNTSSDAELIDSIRRAITEDARRREVRERHAGVQARLDRLTPREREVMEMVVTGKTNKEIAATLSRSPKTVEVHRAQVMRKMRVDSLAELVRLSLSASHNVDPVNLSSRNRQAALRETPSEVEQPLESCGHRLH